MNQIIVFSKMVESETVMFTNNWINYDVERYMKPGIFLWRLRAQSIALTMFRAIAILFYKTLV